MKHLLLPLAVCLFCIQQTWAQSDIFSRTSVSANLAPFYHGVASGDPLPDRVIIWTRYTPDVSPNPVTINWEMATDINFSNIVQNGNMLTQSSRDWSVKVDVTGLTENTFYYYRFEYDGNHSIVGRTRTAPTGAVDSLRFAVASCSDYSVGYFHGYRDMAERNDIDAVIHLGDYIYESGSSGSVGRPHEPAQRITELNDYRQRYSQYRLDADLRCAHQMYPFINVWDDHELANNAWLNGAGAHTESTDGLWEDRKSFATRAFHEWIPFRAPNPVDSVQIYRALPWGNLVDLFMADTRIIGRDEQDAGAIDDPNRNLLGQQQLGWLVDGMNNSTAQWKILGQQVLMAALEIPPFGGIVLGTSDAWNGYRAERNNLYDSVLVKNIENLVVLTGDIHTAWANNLEKGGNKVGVEFVTSSITKPNAGISLGTGLITSTNPHIEYVELAGHGYYILDINQDRVQVDFQWIGDISDETDLSRSEGPFWQTLDASRELSEANAPSIARPSVSPSLPPNACGASPVGIEKKNPIAAVIGTYPNPFWENFVVKTYLFDSQDVSVQLYDLKGALITETASTQLHSGLHYIEVSGNGIAKGTYLLKMTIGKKVFSRTVVRI